MYCRVALKGSRWLLRWPESQNRSISTCRCSCAIPSYLPSRGSNGLQVSTSRASLACTWYCSCSSSPPCGCAPTHATARLAQQSATHHTITLLIATPEAAQLPAATARTVLLLPALLPLSSSSPSHHNRCCCCMLHLRMWKGKRPPAHTPTPTRPQQLRTS